MTGRLVAPLSWLVLGLTALGGELSLFGLPPLEWLRYVAHALLFVALPGLTVYAMARRDPVPPLTLLTQGACLGLCLETLTYLALLAVGHPGAIVAYPWPFLLLALGSRRRLLSRIEATEPPRSVRSLGVLAVILLVIFTSGLEAMTSVANLHATWPVAYARAGLDGWPLADPFVFGETVRYHYLYYLHFSVAHRVTGQPFLVLITRTAVPIGLALLVLLLYDVARGLGARWWLALLVPLQALLSMDFAMGALYRWFGHTTAASSFHVPATLAGHLVFFAVLREVWALLPGSRLEWGRWSVLAVMILAASGLRSSVLPVLGAATGLVLLVRAAERRAVPWAPVALISLIGASFAWGLWLFYGLGTANDATAAMTFEPFSPASAGHLKSFRWGLAQGLPGRLWAGVTLLLAQIGQTTFLLPGFVLFVAAWLRGQGRADLWRWFLLGSWLAGGAVVMLFRATGGVGTFAQYGAIGAGLLAVDALEARLAGGGGRRRPGVLVAATLGLLVLHLADVAASGWAAFAKEGLPRTSPVFFEATSPLGRMAAKLPSLSTPRMLFVVSGRPEQCRQNTEMRLVAAEDRFHLFASARIVGLYARRSGAGSAIRLKRDLLGALAEPPRTRLQGLEDLRRLLPPGYELAVLDCNNGRLPRLPPGALVIADTGGLSLLRF